MRLLFVCCFFLFRPISAADALKMREVAQYSNAFGFNSVGIIAFSIFFGVVLAERCEGDDIIFDVLGTFTRVLLSLSRVIALYVLLTSTYP